MKKITFTFLLIFLASIAFAQVAQAYKYQVEDGDAEGKIMANADNGLQRAKQNNSPEVDFYQNGGNVGIGTTAPAAPRHVSGPALVEDVSTIKPKQIAVGSSEHVWMLDAADNTILYRRNPNTFRYDKVQSNIAVTAIDVSGNGVLVALSGNKLYIWDKSSQSFKASAATQRLDHVTVGKDGIWGMFRSSFFQLDSETGQFVQIPTGSGQFITMAKEDNSVWIIGDNSKKLYQWDSDSQTWELQATYTGSANLVWLTVRDENTVWALADNGKLLQWNPRSGRLFDQSAKLPLSTGTNSIGVDENKILYEAGTAGFTFHDAGTIALDHRVTAHIARPVSAIAPDGIHHMIYNHKQGIYHSYSLAGDDGSGIWLQSKPLPNAATGSDLNLVVDDSGTLHASWISGLANDKEIYYAQGVKNSDVGGYDWSNVTQVSNDEAAEEGLHMMVTSRGTPVFLSSKSDHLTFHGDRDNYQHLLDLVEHPLTFDGQPLVNSYRESVPFNWSSNPLGSLLKDPGLLQGGMTGIFVPQGTSFGYGWEKSDKFKLDVYIHAADIAMGGELGVRSGIETRLEVVLLEEPAEVCALIVVNVAYQWTGEQLFIVGCEFEVEVMYPLVHSPPTLQELEDFTGTKFAAGLMFKVVWAFSELEIAKEEEEEEEYDKIPSVDELYSPGADSGAFAQSLTSAMPSFIRVQDKSGTSPPPSGTPVHDMISYFDWKGYGNYLSQLLLGGFAAEGPTEQALVSSNVESDFKFSSWHVGAGVFANYDMKENGHSLYGAHLRAFASIFGDPDPSAAREEFKIWLTYGPWRMYLVRLVFLESFGSSLSYSPGGSTVAHAPGALLGDGDGTNTVDEGRIHATVIGSNAVGTFKQETGDSDFEAVFSIAGTVDANTGSINWDESSVYRIPGSGGFDSDPEITRYQSGGKNKLLIVWGGVPSSDPDVQKLAATPPGRAYLIMGQDPSVGIAGGTPDSIFPVHVWRQADTILTAGDYKLVWQGDNLVIQRNGTEEIWSSATNGRGAMLAFQGDGNFLVRDSSNTAIWSTITADGEKNGKGGRDLILYPNGNIVIHNVDGTAIWQSGSEHIDQNNQINLDYFTDLYGEEGVYYSNNKSIYAIGSSVSALGDVNGGGKPDFIIGAPDAEVEQGRAYLLFGETYNQNTKLEIDKRSGSLGLVLSGPGDSELGYAVSSAGDFNRDGKPDLAVSAPGANSHTGSVYVLYGGPKLAGSTGIVDVESTTLPGTILSAPATGTHLGTALAGGFDLTADGHDDLLVGSSDENIVYLYTAPNASPYKFGYSISGGLGGDPASNLGDNLAMVPDLNGDGKADILLGSSGSTYLLFGGLRLSNYITRYVASWTAEGENGEEYQVVVNFTGSDKDGDGVLRGRGTNPNSGIEGNYSNELSGYTVEVFKDGTLFDSADLSNMENNPKSNFNFDLTTQQILADGDLHEFDGIYIGSAKLNLHSGADGIHWTGTNGYELLLDFEGVDRDGDGILRGRGSTPSMVNGNHPNELTYWHMQVKLNNKVVYSSGNKPSNLNFNYDLTSKKVLMGAEFNSTNGLFIGDAYTIDAYIGKTESHKVVLYRTGTPPNRTKVSNIDNTSGSDDQIQLFDSALNVLASSSVGNNAFALLSVPGEFDLRFINDIPSLGVIFRAAAGAPLHVAAAGDINHDQLGDFLVSYDVSQDKEQQPVSGKAYLLYGSKNLTALDEIDLEQIESTNQGMLLNVGGAVSAAGDVNGDGVDDFIVSEPSPISGNTKGYIYYGKMGANPEPGPTIIGTDSLELAGISLASVGDLNGDGKSELLLGAPYLVDSDVLMGLAEKTQIKQAVLPYPSSGAPWSVSTFPVTNAVGIMPQTIGQTGTGALMTWVEPDPNNAARNILFGAFTSGDSWGAAKTVRQSSADISSMNISDPGAVSTSQESVPTLVWHEEDTTGNKSLWQAVYSRANGNWTAQLMQVVAATTAPGATTNQKDALLNVEESTYRMLDAAAAEDDGEVTVTILRSGDLNTTHELFYRTVDLSATAGSDYQHAAGVVRFASGEQLKQIKIKVHGDEHHEPEGEHLQVELISTHPLAHRTLFGRRISGTARTTSIVHLSETERVLELTSINSGFIMAGKSGARLGGALSPAGDVNGDGFKDFLVGAPAADNNKGCVYLVYGMKGIEIRNMNQPLDYLALEQGVVFSGTEANAQAGAAVAGGKAANTFIAIGAPGTDLTTGKVYVFKNSSLSGKNSIQLGSGSPLIISGTGNVKGNYFGSKLLVADMDNNGQDDLVIMAPGKTPTGSPGQVYIVYDSFLNTGTSGAIDGGNANVDVISSSSGSGFGKALASGDFDGDKLNDLVLGSPGANPVVDARGATKGSGGYVYVIWGKNSRLGALDLSNLGSAGRIFMGQAAINKKSASISGDGESMRPSQDLALGVGLTDFAGDAAALLNFDGDNNGVDELVIGAPRAWVAGSDGILTADDKMTGRVYILFGGSHWRNSNSPYPLIHLYGNDYKNGLVLEGTLTGGQAGSSLANVGAFRGTTDSGCDDILIGAPMVGSNAGQSYLVFGSTNHYDMSKQQKGANIQWLDPVGDATHPRVPLLFSFQGIVNPLSDDNPVNSGNVGAAVTGVGDINGDGATDVLIGAPTASENDIGQLYAPIGHTWIKPGQHLNVKDLRSDNGFVLEESGVPVPVGDFNNDGYDDFVLTGPNPKLVLGATALANVNGVREYDLGVKYSSFRATWTGTNGYQAIVDFAGKDLDGDGILRGRGSNKVISLGGYSNELTYYQMQVIRNNELYTTSQNMKDIFNFNVDLYNYEVIVGRSPRDNDGINMGNDLLRNTSKLSTVSNTMEPRSIRLSYCDGRGNVSGGISTSDAYGFSITTHANDVKTTTFDNVDVKTTASAQETIYRGYWQATSGNKYRVFVDFSGVDRDGDGILRGRGNNPDRKMVDNHNNELKTYSLRIFDAHGNLITQYSLLQQLKYTRFNLNYQLSTKRILAGGNWTSKGGVSLGNSSGYLLVVESSKILLYHGTTVISQTAAGNTLFHVSSQPFITTGPVAYGDFNGDGAHDFVLFRNIDAITPATVFSDKMAAGLLAQDYSGDSDIATAMAASTPHVVPLQYIGGALGGDINGDGYDDMVISGYAAAKDKSFIFAYYGSPQGLGWDNLDTIYTETNMLSRHLLSLIDLTNNGQDDIVTYGITRIKGIIPFNYQTPIRNDVDIKYNSLYTYGAETVGGTPGWHEISLKSAIFFNQENDPSDIINITAGKPVDVDNDGYADLNLNLGFLSTSSEASVVLRSTGNFTFTDDAGKWETFFINHSLSNFSKSYYSLSSTQDSWSQTRINGISDFNQDGIDDLLCTNREGADATGLAVYNYVVYGSGDLWGSKIVPGPRNTDFKQGVAIEGFDNLYAGYIAADAGDMNGDGFGDIVMSNNDADLTYGLYGFRLEETAATDYMVGSDGDDVLLQVASTQYTTVNVSGKGGDDFIQTVLPADAASAPYNMVLSGGPGDDVLGVSTVQSETIVRIDGGNGFDQLFISPYYSGGAETLDLTVVNRRIRSIELIDLGNTNGLKFNFRNVRDLSEDSNTLLLKGTDARAKPVEKGSNWAARGRNSHDGVVYDVYEYLPGGSAQNLGSSGIQVWLEHGGVTWHPLGQ